MKSKTAEIRHVTLLAAEHSIYNGKLGEEAQILLQAEIRRLRDVLTQYQQRAAPTPDKWISVEYALPGPATEDGAHPPLATINRYENAYGTIKWSYSITESSSGSGGYETAQDAKDAAMETLRALKAMLSVIDD